MTRQAPYLVPIVSGSLKAMIDKQPGPGRPNCFLALVDVEVEVGWTVSLVAAAPQGINPLIKLLRLRVEIPPGPQSARIARRTLRYEEAPPRADYREVWLGEGDAAISAKVSIVV